MTPRRPTHYPLLIWVAREQDPIGSLALEMSINALTHLLAGAVAVDLDSKGNRVAIVTLDKSGSQQRVDRWDGTKFVKVADSFPVPFTTQELRDWVPPKGMPRRGLVFVVNIDDPLGLPRYLSGDARLNQAVYVTPRVLDSVPDPLKLGLDKWARQALFNGVVSTVMRDRRGESGLQRFVDGIRGSSPWDTRDEPDPSHISRRDSDGEAARLFRDACNLTLDIGAAGLDVAWKDYEKTGRPRALHLWLGDKDQERVRRWGRAVTNRRAGVAISGGGASAYRTVPLLKELEQPKEMPGVSVPIDVVAGLSGGALIGAYFAALGQEGTERVKKRGLFFQIAMPIAAFMTWPLQFVVDSDLDFARVEELDVRYAALTTMHRRTGEPEAGVVVDATMGEAVRASGTLPPMFATTDKHGTHYTDGGASALVPSIAARDCGADITLSVNVLSGPNRSNILEDMWFGIGDFLYDHTPVSRLVDFFVWYTFMWRRASRRFGVLADEYLEYTPEKIPMMESVFFMCAGSIEEKGRVDERVGPAIGRFRALYQRLQRF